MMMTNPSFRASAPRETRNLEPLAMIEVPDRPCGRPERRDYFNEINRVR